jgi:hypothetical protein
MHDYCNTAQVSDHTTIASTYITDKKFLCQVVSGSLRRISAVRGLYGQRSSGRGKKLKFYSKGALLIIRQQALKANFPELLYP